MLAACTWAMGASYWICHAVTVICYPFSSLVPSVLVGYFYVRDSASTNSFRHSIKLIFTFSLFFMFAFISSIHCFFISSSSFLLMDCTREVRGTDVDERFYTFSRQMIWLLRNVLKTMDHLLAGHVLQLLLADVALPHPSLQSFVLGLQLPVIVIVIVFVIVFAFVMVFAFVIVPVDSLWPFPEQVWSSSYCWTRLISFSVGSSFTMAFVLICFARSAVEGF